MDVVFHTNCFDGTLSLSLLTLMDFVYKPPSDAPETPFSSFLCDRLAAFAPVTVLDTWFPEKELQRVPAEVPGKLTAAALKSMAAERDLLGLSCGRGGRPEENLGLRSQRHRFFPLLVDDYQRPFERLLREEGQTRELLLIVDCSATLDVLKLLLPRYKLVAIVDHHLTLGRSLDSLLSARLPNLRIVFSTANSASFLMARLFQTICGEFWDFLDRRAAADLTLKLVCVDAKDTSATKDPDANALVEKAFALRLNQPEARNYEGRTAFLGVSAETLIELGRPALRLRDGYVEEMVRRRVRVRVDLADSFKGEKNVFFGFGLKGLKAVKHLSEVGNRLAFESAKMGDDGFGLICREGGDGTFYVSLRSEEGLEFDCEAVARHFGGGGHRMAAGFTVSKSKFRAFFAFLG